MFKTHKILTLIFITLIFVSAIEVGYYIFISYYRNTQKTQKTTVSTSKTQEYPPVSISDNWSHPDKAINKETTEKWYTALRWFYNDTLKSSVLSNEFNGIITNINYDGRRFAGGGKEYEGIEYAKMLEIQGEKSNRNKFFYKESDLRNLKIIKIASDGAEIPLKFDDLKSGNYINMKITIDLSKNFDESQIENKIRVTNQTQKHEK